MRVDEAMVRPVVTVEEGTPVKEAARLMLAYRISGVPVVARDGRLVGMVSEGDFLRRAEIGTAPRRPWWLELFVNTGRIADEYVRAHARTVGEIMNRDVAAIAPDASVEAAVEMMVARRVKRLPVVEGGRIVGIIARSDLLRAISGMPPAAGEASGKAGDDDIRRAIAAEIAAQPWGRNGLIRVEVADGVVELTGVIFDERYRAAARVAAENVPGVKGVTDDLLWIDPASGVTIAP